MPCIASRGCTPRPTWPRPVRGVENVGQNEKDGRGSPPVSGFSRTGLVAAPTSTTATATATATAAAILGFVHSKATAPELGAVEGADCVLRGALLCHLDEGEPSWTTRVAIRDYVDRIDAAVALENAAEFVLGAGEGEVSDIKLLTQLAILAVSTLLIGARPARDSVPDCLNAGASSQ